MYIQNEKRKYNIVSDKTEWDKSPNISPGTEFMDKLGNKLMDSIKKKVFNKHNSKMNVIFSSSNVPGEGEHKFLPMIRGMAKSKTFQDSKVYLYGKDADLIVLAISTHKNNMHIVREVKSESDAGLKKIYQDYEFLDLHIDNLRTSFNHELTKKFEGHTFDKIRVLNDYIFLTFLVGNDFVLSMSFLKIKSDGLEKLIRIYQNIKMNNHEIGYLIEEDIPKINIPFFKELIFEISKNEDIYMKNQQHEVNKLMNGRVDNRRAESEIDMSPFDIIQTRYIHLQVCHPDHPLYSKYFQEFLKIDYNQDYEVWKEQYYKYFLNIDKKNEGEYLDVRMKVVKNYLESLMFTLKYYFLGCPSWKWHYQFRISPLPSDIYYCLDQSLIDMNTISFEVGRPYTPFEQLMLILPPQLDSLVPVPLRQIMSDDKLLCSQFYPTNFVIDVVQGIKTQYSEAILPEIDEELLIKTVEKYVRKITDKSEIERNQIKEKPLMYDFSK
jgi:5'-3' exonuclease